MKVRRNRKMKIEVMFRGTTIIDVKEEDLENEEDIGYDIVTDEIEKKHKIDIENLESIIIASGERKGEIIYEF
jgi:hypothetical protein